MMHELHFLRKIRNECKNTLGYYLYYWYVWLVTGVINHIECKENSDLDETFPSH